MHSFRLRVCSIQPLEWRRAAPMSTSCTNTETSTIEATGTEAVFGVIATSAYYDATVENAGSIAANGYSGAYGVRATAARGDGLVTVTNLRPAVSKLRRLLQLALSPVAKTLMSPMQAVFDASSDVFAIGVEALAGYAEVSNSGSISVDSSLVAVGILAAGASGVDVAIPEALMRLEMLPSAYGQWSRSGGHECRGGHH